jgi:hypothetical protein
MSEVPVRRQTMPSGVGHFAAWRFLFLVGGRETEHFERTELIPTRGALFPRGGPVHDPDLTHCGWQVRTFPDGVRGLAAKRQVRKGQIPQSGIKSSVSVALMCTKRRRVPASASTNQGPEKGDFVLL